MVPVISMVSPALALLIAVWIVGSFIWLVDEPSTIIVFPNPVMFSSAITAEENVNSIVILKKINNIFL